MLVVGVFIPIVQATTGAANDVRKRVIVDVYLTSDATQADAARVRAQLLDTANVKRVEFVSKQDAYQQQRKKDPEAFALLGSNPLPDTFRVTPEDPDDVLKIASALAPEAAGGGRTPIDSSIDEVRTRRDDTTKILQVTRFVKLMAGTLAILLIAASIFLIANTIRLSLYARRREVEVMKLVGATDWFIRWPFVIEGIIVGALGTLLAILLLAVGKIAIIDPLASDFALISTPDTMPFTVLIAVMMAAGIAISAVGSAVSLRRFLRV
jgi:cell division transport system permease protein